MQHWDDYWQNTKALNSFAEGEQGSGYNGAIAEFWHQQFTALPANARILDLACGNGALAVLALQFSNEFQVYGSDAAQIKPLEQFSERDNAYPFLQQIRFFPSMPSEQLSFSDQSFDAVYSQFGFEYGDTEQSLLQILRVLKPGGRFTALIHHSASFITKDCQDGIDTLAYFLAEDTGLYRRVRDFAAMCQRLAAHLTLSPEQQRLLQQHSQQLMQQFRACQQRLSESQLDWFSELAQPLVTALSNWRQLNPAHIDKLQQRQRIYLQRLQDQIAAAWDQQKVSELQQKLSPHWQAVSITPLYEQNSVLAWSLELVS